MNNLLYRRGASSTVHRICRPPNCSSGIRWSSYVGDVRMASNLSKSYHHHHHSPSSIHHNRHHYRHSPSSRGAMIIATRDYHVGGVEGGGGGLSMTTPNHHRRHQQHERLLVIGSGVAGCAAALSAARHGIRTTVLHAGRIPEDCNSYWAQGGIVYKNYELRTEGGRGDGGDGGRMGGLVDTSLSLVEDVRRASGYRRDLERTHDLEETSRYSSSMRVNGDAMGRKCPISGVNWNEDAAWKLALEGPRRVRELLLGSIDGGSGDDGLGLGCVVPFDRRRGNDDGEDGGGSRLGLCLEASHSAPRIAYLADRTGRAITEGITRAASSHPLIDFVGDAIAIDLLFDDDGEGGGCDDEYGYDTTTTTVIGARVHDSSAGGRTYDAYASRGVVLASGGLAGIYEHTTNPVGYNALGSSAALALRLEDRIIAGSSSSSGGRRGGGGGRKRGGGEGVVSDLEYVQFHPTALCVPGESRFLLTEALRGEGAILRDSNGRPFAKDYHPDGELAPRDVVARAVYEEIRRASSSSSSSSSGKGKGDGRRRRHGAYLDITHRDPSWLVGRFPGVHAHLTSLRTGPLDLTNEGIPVTPAAHYACGGVTTDLDGRVVAVRSIPGGGGGEGKAVARRHYRNLYAAGEAARTGLHGGNRLASTSLLEGLVFGSSVGEVVAGVIDDGNDMTEATRAATDRARRVIERRSATTIPSSSSSISSSRPDDAVVAREASAALTRLRSVMWEDVGVVRSVPGLERASSELSAILDEADRLWDEGGGTREVAALRDAARAGLAVADAALSNRVSGGCHYLAATEEEEDGTRGGGAKEQDSDSDDDDGLVVARA